MFKLSGWASTPDLDAEDHVFALKSFALSQPFVPLLHRHEEGNEAGEITKLEWRPQGLWIECLAKDQYADLPAFSVRVAVRDYEIKGKGREAFALVTRGILREVSLTPEPCNKSCRVVSRERAQVNTLEPAIKALEAMQQTAARMQRMLAEMQS